MTDSLIRYATTFESTNNLPMSIEIGHGENADLVASFKDGGIDVNLSGYTARAIYQPKSKWGTDDWYECPCEISDNKTIAHWDNACDNGENAVKLFMYLSKDDKVAYPAIYQIRLFETPGFSPSAIEPIPKTIDFAQYQLENAPWVLPSDLSGYATKAEATLSVTYSQNPQFTDWTVNYSFEVSWDNEHSIWVFESGFGDTVSGDTAEWHNPNATHLYVYHADTDLEANRTRLDVGYVLGSQADKPLQPMGDYASASDVNTLSGTVGTLSGNVNTLTGNVSTLSGNVSILNTNKADKLSVLANSGTPFLNGSLMIGDMSYSPDALEYKCDSIKVWPGAGYTYEITFPLSAGRLALESQVNALSNSTLKTSQLITSITSSSTDLEVPTGKAVYDAIQEGGGGGGGGATGYTVTFANDFEERTHDGHLLTTAPVRFIKADGTSEVVDLHNVAALRGTSIQNVVMLDSGVWQRQSGTFGGIAFGSDSDTTFWEDTDSFAYGRGIWMTMNGIKVGMPFIVPEVAFGNSQNAPWNKGHSSPFTQLHLTGDVTINYTRTGLVCLLKGTLIRLANGQDKPIEEITYDDDILVWDFDNGKFSSAKPIWIKKPQIAPYYFRNILGNGRELLTTGKSKTGWGHRMFDIDKEMFRYTTESVADRIFTLDGIEIHKSCERIVEECEFYNIITENHFNLFANGILTSCSLNNLYPISGMKFKKDENREFRPFEAYDVPLKYYKGLRLGEQCGDIGELTEYVKRLIDFEK